MSLFKRFEVYFATFLMVSTLVVLSSSRPAEAMRISLLGGISDMTSTAGGTTLGGLGLSGNGLGYTGGVDLGFSLVPMLELTVGAEYLARKFTVSDSVTILGVTESASASGSLSYFHIPAIVFFNLAPMFSIGAGGFYDLAISSGAPTNYGLTGALRIKFGMTPLFIEGRYNYGLDSSDWGGNTSEVEGMIGLMF